MRPFDGYPDSWGAKRAAIVAIAGPASYTQVSAGTAPALSTGGQTVQALIGGLKLVDGVVVLGLSDSGTYRVEVVHDSVSGIVATPGYIPRPATTFRLRWIVVATGAQAAGSADLDAEIVRLLLIGPK